MAELNYESEVDYYTKEISRYADTLYLGRLYTDKQVDNESKSKIINRLRFLLNEIGDICSEAEL